MTWDGVVHIMEEINYPRECWETAEFLWQSGDEEMLLGMLNAHAVDAIDGSWQRFQSLTVSLPAPAEVWALEAAERLLEKSKNCPRTLLAWVVARAIEVEFERRDYERARESERRLREPPFGETDA
jgi:hypothetical protein